MTNQMVQYAGQQGWKSPIEWKMGGWENPYLRNQRPLGIAQGHLPYEWSGNRGPGSGTLQVTPEMRPQLDAFLAYLDMNKRRGDIENFNWGSQGQQMPWERPRYPQFPGIPGGGFPGFPGGGGMTWDGSDRPEWMRPGGGHIQPVIQPVLNDHFQPVTNMREHMDGRMFYPPSHSRTYSLPRIPPWMQARATTGEYTY